VTDRKSISKKTRFEIFKRDGFSCQYCGATPPGVLLHLDHIVALANGGADDSDNLVTSCEPCNLGKGARALTAVPQSLSDKAAEVAERESQLHGFYEVLEARRQRKEGELWRVAEVLEPGCSKKGFSKDALGGIRNFIDKLGLYDVLEAADLACDRKSYPGHARFRYFCGICWNKIKGD
jgi:hypothetical protein